MNLDEHEKYMAEWHKKHGMPVDLAHASETFLEPDSEMDDTLTVWLVGDRLQLSDSYGWAEEYALTDIRALVKEHGKLATWDDFSRLGDLESRDCADDE